uniref:Uncharacterized protein n=1 Tax=Rhizophora mucronata TaxID=61149 RepID=A0A2P2L898_RHIMU
MKELVTRLYLFHGYAQKNMQSRELIMFFIMSPGKVKKPTEYYCCFKEH